MVLGEIQRSVLHRSGLVLSVLLLCCLLYDNTQHRDNHLRTSTSPYISKVICSITTDKMRHSFFSLPWLHTFSFRESLTCETHACFFHDVWLHSKLLVTTVAKTIKSYTCAGLPESEETQTQAWGSRWSEVFCFLWSHTMLWMFVSAGLMFSVIISSIIPYVRSCCAQSNPPRPLFLLEIKLSKRC